MNAWSARQVQIAAAVAAVLVLVTIGAGAAFGAFSSKDKISRPGLLAELPDGRKLNFRCEGQGSPTVLLESGFGAWSNAWVTTAPRIATVTRVCAYDRAGAGFSDPGPMPRDGAAIARDLDAGLKAAHIEGPFVVVGHSAGGLYARLFAARRRNDVVGLVFVDSSVEHQVERARALAGANVGGLEGVERRPLECLRAISAPKGPASLAARDACISKSDDVHQHQIEQTPAYWRTQVSELDNLFTTTSDEVDRIGPLLAEIPAVVLTASSADGPAHPGAIGWEGFHNQLAAGFRKSEHRLVKSSHLIMIERPDVVADAAIALVKAARQP